MKQIVCSSNSLHLNHKAQTIEMTKAFYKEASCFGSKAYKTLNEARHDFPTYDLVILRQKAKDSHKGLTLKSMKKFFENHSEEYKEAKELFEKCTTTNDKDELVLAKGINFITLREWFLSEVKEIDEKETEKEESPLELLKARTKANLANAS
ncbi:MAG: hypothetical protein ACI4IW_01395 [Oscillospiraceae bacterium]